MQFAAIEMAAMLRQQTKLLSSKDNAFLVGELETEIRQLRLLAAVEDIATEAY